MSVASAMVDGLAGWIAPVATMLAAIMTASNLGARVTGYGFVVFTLGSLAWCLVAISSGQSNLLWTNGFLVVVNLIGIWRWLGRQARFDDAGKSAASGSEDSPDADLSPLSTIIGAKVVGPDDQALGKVVDALVRSHDCRVSYFVISDGGFAGVGERLYGLDASEARVVGAVLTTQVTRADLDHRTALQPDDWPAALSRSERRCAPPG